MQVVLIYILYMECMCARVAGCGSFTLNIRQSVNIINLFAPNFLKIYGVNFTQATAVALMKSESTYISYYI